MCDSGIWPTRFLDLLERVNFFRIVDNLVHDRVPVPNSDVNERMLGFKRSYEIVETEIPHVNEFDKLVVFGTVASQRSSVKRRYRQQQKMTR